MLFNFLFANFQMSSHCLFVLINSLLSNLTSENKINITPKLIQVLAVKIINKMPSVSMKALESLLLLTCVCPFSSSFFTFLFVSQRPTCVLWTLVSECTTSTTEVDVINILGQKSAHGYTILMINLRYLINTEITGKISFISRSWSS